MRVDSFDYELPTELIAQVPAPERDGSRLLIVDRRGDEAPIERCFVDLPELLDEGDLVVLNDALVEPVRLRARRHTGGSVELLMLGPRESDPGAGEGRSGALWEALVRPAKRVRSGDRLTLTAAALNRGEGSAGRRRPDVELRVVGEGESGRKLIALPEDVDAAALFDACGEMPLPPYIRRDPADRRAALDRERYQTVYARRPGAVAAPTAGLHFTERVLAGLERRGIRTATLTLRVGAGTFRPVRVDNVADHAMEAEPYVVPPQTAEYVEAARRRGARVVGVGTTVVRALEHATRHGGLAAGPARRWADLFIYPGFEFRVIDAMLTNFHLPRSTPLLMAAAFAGTPRLLRAYRQAVADRFRFYSYGDAMLIR